MMTIVLLIINHKFKVEFLHMGTSHWQNVFSIQHFEDTKELKHETIFLQSVVRRASTNVAIELIHCIKN